MVTESQTSHVITVHRCVVTHIRKFIIMNIEYAYGLSQCLTKVLYYIITSDVVWQSLLIQTSPSRKWPEYGLQLVCNTLVLLAHGIKSSSTGSKPVQKPG